MSDSILAVLITQLITIFVVVYESKQQLRRSRYESQIAARLRRMEQQLREFYGPLQLMLDRSAQLWDTARGELASMRDERARIILKHGILPLYAEIAGAIQSRSYLMDVSDEKERYVKLLLHSDRIRIRIEQADANLGGVVREGDFEARIHQQIRDMHEKIRRGYHEAIVIR